MTLGEGGLWRTPIFDYVIYVQPLTDLEALKGNFTQISKLIINLVLTNASNEMIHRLLNFVLFKD